MIYIGLIILGVFVIGGLVVIYNNVNLNSTKSYKQNEVDPTVEIQKEKVVKGHTYVPLPTHNLGETSSPSPFNAGKRWTSNEVKRLLELRREEKSLDDISFILGRTVSSIKNKLARSL